jgi:hypothetical protein
MGGAKPRSSLAREHAPHDRTRRMKLLNPKDPAERKALVASYEGDLASDEVVTLLSVEIEVLAGTDPAYAAVLSGQPVMLSATREVLQWVVGGVRDVDYGIRFLVNGSKGGVHLSSCRLPVRRL